MAERGRFLPQFPDLDDGLVISSELPTDRDMWIALASSDVATVDQLLASGYQPVEPIMAELAAEKGMDNAAMIMAQQLGEQGVIMALTGAVRGNNPLLVSLLLEYEHVGVVPSPVDRPTVRGKMY